jgi:predicted sugar kinase
VDLGSNVSLVEALADTLTERVDKLVQAGKEPVLSTTPVSLAVEQLVARTEALEMAVREIALEVQKLSALGS